MAATFEDIMSGLQKRIFKPIYFLAGEEPYYIDLISDYAEKNILEESERDFNQMVLYGRDTNVRDIMNIARRFPMMSSHMVVIVKEAQELSKIDDLIYYVEKPLESTILILCYKYRSLDKRLKLAKTLDKQGNYFESTKLRDYQVPAWIEKYLAQKQCKIDPNAGSMLVDYLGTDLQKISNELDKLMITMPKDNRLVTTNLIEEKIGISKEFNNFELQKAIGEKNILKANMIVNYLANNQKNNPLLLTISTLFSFFSKILAYHYTKDKSRNNLAAVLKVNPFFVKDYEIAATKYNIAKTVQIINLLRTYDLKSKGFGNSGTEPGDILRELTFKILH